MRPRPNKPPRGTALAGGGASQHAWVPPSLRESKIAARRPYPVRVGVPLGPSYPYLPFVESRRWWLWAREGCEEAHVFAGDTPCTGEDRHRVSARFYALQSMIN